LIIINSNTYLNQSLQLEFGQLPLAFIPINGKRLYELQINHLKKKYKNEDIVIILPKNYHINDADRIKLFKKKVEILHIDNLKNVYLKIKDLKNFQKGLIFLNGDRLIIDGPNKLNEIAIAEIGHDYNYEFEYLERGDDNNKIYAGLFTFKKSDLFFKFLVKENGDFYKSLLRYRLKESMNYKNSKKWYDLGSIKNYFHTKTVFTTERKFNHLKIINSIVQKSGLDKKKIINEARWYENVPVSIRRFTPQFYIKNTKKPFYSIEYLNNQSLSDLFVFGRHSLGFWKLILNKLNDYLKDAITLKTNKSEPTTLLNLTLEKTKLRLEYIKNNLNIDLNSSLFINDSRINSLNEMFEECSKIIISQKPMNGFLHGDLCLSNILFDSRSNNLKFIDPRAEDKDKKFTNYGDINYDIAKLGHSFIGLYDFILAGQYKLRINKNKFLFEILNNNERDEIDNYIYDFQFFNGKKFKDYLPIIITLFLSMIPLHNDSKRKQQALLANSMRLYKCL